MSHQQIVALAGESLLTDSVEASLRTKPDFSVVRLVPGSELYDGRTAVRPDLIIADLHALQFSHMLAYLMKYPDVALLGIDPISSRVLALSCQHHTVETADDLARVIREMAPPARGAAHPTELATVLDTGHPVRDTAPRSP